ncbi:MAG TPA: DUF2339 domain-containing protein [Vicinamibacteria bacterium]|nr:DUF2339 domain-containing protein [Vicinamibacteria bacterium]
MEGALVLVGLMILALAVVGPLLAVVALVRTRRFQSRIEKLQADQGALETRFAAFLKINMAERARPAEGPGAAPTPSPLVQSPPPTPPAPAAPPRPATPVVAPPVAAPPAPSPERPAPPATPPPRPPRPAPPPPSTPVFDWESLLGLKGAAWLGGIALVVAAIFLAKMAYDRGYFTPELRMVSMLGAGIGGLVWAELSLRKGYATTANAVSGAAIAILYIALYAGHALWHLLATAPTFGMMILVTIVAGLVAIRYDAVFTAVLGLVGGFATPISLSTGEDRPVSLFSYILLLNLGLLAVAVKRGWHSLVLLGLLGTFALEVGWFGKFMSPEKMIVGLLAFLLFGLLYLFLPTLAGEEEQPTLRLVGGLGVAVSFLFGVLIAGNGAYIREWELLFGYLALLDAALIAVALFRRRTVLLLSGAVATGATLFVWAVQGIPAAGVWGPTLAAIALATLLNAPVRLGRLLAPERVEEDRSTFEGAGIAAGAGLGLFALAFVMRTPGDPLWPFVALLGALIALFVERSGERRLAGVALLGPLALALLIQVWLHHRSGGETLLRNLSVPLLLAITVSLVAARRAEAPVNANEDEAGVVGATLIAVAGLFACLVSPELGRDPGPLFVALAITLVLLVASALRRDWTWLLPGGLLLAALFATAWQFAFFHPPQDLVVVLPGDTAFYLAFLGLPFVMPARIVNLWKMRPAPWLASALAGPAFFLPLHDSLVRSWGKGMIGLLPLAMAALTVPALAGISRRFVARAGDREGEGHRLRYMALFAAVALGLVAVAIPLQLDRQWITVGWALEAAAVFWLFGRLPHPGLKTFGALLYGLVGVRLLLNWDNVLRYEARGGPIFNWLLYTYGVPALCCLLGAAALARAETTPGSRRYLAPAVSLLGLVLIFVLINLEVVDFYSAQRYLEFTTERALARDLTMSVAWALYATILLVIGFWRERQALRFLSLGFLGLTVAKVFLYDLSTLAGIYRVLALLALGVVSIVVSLLYGRALRQKERPT